MGGLEYTKGLHEVGDGVFAYLQPDGGWGWSNAGLVQSSDGSLLVDTLFDLALTAEMLTAMQPVTAAAPIGTLVNTHANGDHCYGNQLVEGAEVITSAASAREMDELPPSTLAGLTSVDLGELANRYVEAAFGPFDFRGIDPIRVDRTFEKELELDIGGRPVHLYEVGPAHTAGDVLVHLPDDGAIFCGDILFIGGTPIIWDGPVANWVAACERILGLGCDVIVPGHGPLTDAEGVRAVRDYLVFLRREVELRFEAGLSATEAVHDIDLGPYRDWGEWERVVVNVDQIYGELGAPADPDVPNVFQRMAELRYAR